MLFDQLCGIAEKHLPEFMPMLKEARIFRLPPHSQPEGTLGEVLQAWDEDTRLIENFRLPFPVVVFEQTGARHGRGDSLIMLAEINGNQQGVIDPVPRMLAFVAMEPVWLMVGAVQALPLGKLSDDIREVVPVQTLGRIRTFRCNPFVELPNRNMGGRLSVEDIDGMVAQIDQLREILPELHRDGRKAEAAEVEDQLTDLLRGYITLHGAEMAGQGVFLNMFINNPAMFIVEERPLKLNDKIKNPKRVLRSTHRPHYIVLKPAEIKTKLLGLSEDEVAGVTTDESGRKVRPHERRGHFRKLTSEHFKAARGKIIWIDALWVGPQTAIQGKNRYTVLLDK